MALKIFVSTSIEELLSELLAQLPANNRSVFTPNYLVTQTGGMDNWLKFQVATKLGIAANIKYLRPTAMVSRLFYLTGGRFGRDAFSGDLTWVLYKLLGEEAFERDFPDLARYYGDGQAGDLKRLGLAGKVSDLFDQYQVYRPDMVARWNALSLDAARKEGWQPYLWRRTKEVSGDSMPDKTEVAGYILKHINEERVQDRLRSELPLVYVFGVSVLSPFHMRLFSAAAQVIDFQFFLLLPSLTMLLRARGRGEFKNELLRTWSSLILETSETMLQGVDAGALVELEAKPAEPASLLQKIQYDIHNDQQTVAGWTAADLSDGSLTLSSCYTITREVEVLYNHLVRLVDSSTDPVSVRDISVLLTDVDAYAPYIRAVFDNAPYKIPYSIEGESVEKAEGIISALMAVLRLSEENFSAEAVVGLLDFSYIRRQFGISDVELIRRTVAEANIRFGLENRREDDSYMVGWVHGIRKIILGICMVGEEIYVEGDEEILPYDRLEGSSALEVVRFLHFVQLLMDFIKEQRRPRSLAQWADYLERLTQELIWAPEEEPDEAYGAFLQQLKKLNASNEIMGDELGFEVLRTHFSQQFSMAETTNNRQRGIVFGSLIARRSVPSKIIAVLGLNFDQFPRKDRHLSYDLMAAERLRGDRSLKHNDKHLFLETILAAREQLYLSYIGRSTKDNKERPPSSLLDQLVNYVSSACAGDTKGRESLVLHQPLHGFSNKYGKGPYYSYLKEPSERIKLETREAWSGTEAESVDLQRFIAFFKNPFKAFYKNTAGINYDESPSTQLEENELFELSHLDVWALKNSLLFLSEQEKPDFIKRKLRRGELPLKNMALVHLERINEEIAAAKRLTAELVAGLPPASSLRLSVSLPSMVLTGQLDQVFGERMIFVCFSKREFKYYLDAAIRYLAARAGGLELELFFVSNEKELVVPAQQLSRSSAREYLEYLAKAFHAGHKDIWPFSPDFNFDWLQVQDWPIEELLNKIKKEFTRFKYPLEEPHLLSAFRNRFFENVEVLEAFKDNAQVITAIVREIFPTLNFEN